MTYSHTPLGAYSEREKRCHSLISSKSLWLLDVQIKVFHTRLLFIKPEQGSPCLAKIVIGLYRYEQLMDNWWSGAFEI